MTKNPNVLMKKTKMVTQDKSKKCSLSTEDNPCLSSIYTIQTGFKERRNLCKKHLNEYLNGKNEIPKVVFLNAGEL